MSLTFTNGKELELCPRCGYDEYVVSARIHGKANYYTKFNGDSGDNTNLHEGLIYQLSKTAYCGNCRKRLGKLI